MCTQSESSSLGSQLSGYSFIVLGELDFHGDVLSLGGWAKVSPLAPPTSSETARSRGKVRELILLPAFPGLRELPR